MSDEPWRKEVIDAIHRGKMIDAIKRYREATGVGLAEAKQFVEGLAETMRTGDSPESTAPPPDELEHALVDDLRGGRYIGAIKRHRDATGSDLQESRNAVRGLAQKAGIPVPSPAPVAILVLIVAAIIGGIIAAVYFGR